MAERPVPLIGSILNVLFPRVCPLCENALSEGALCPGCAAGFNARRITGAMCTVCGVPFASSVASSHACGQCVSDGAPFREARSVFVYDAVVAEAIHSFKYGAKVILASPLGRLLFEAAPALAMKPDVVTPVPLHRDRLEARGFNQSLLLARTLAKGLCAELDYMNLKRVRHTPAQIGLKPDERRKNVAGAFEVSDPSAFRGKRTLLVDDVFTTGATVKECSKALKKAGAEVFVLTLARAVKA